MHEIDKYGIGAVMSETLEYVTCGVSGASGSSSPSATSNDLHLHLSFDIDAIDPFYAPHTGGLIFSLIFYFGRGSTKSCFLVEFTHLFKISENKY